MLEHEKLISRFAIPAVEIYGIQYSAGMLEQLGYVAPFADFKAHHPKAKIIYVASSSGRPS
jgi:hypothetical protein